MADTSIVLNNGSGGANLATYADSVSVQHQKVVLELESGAADPVHVSANTGSADTGTIRVVLATNQPSLSNAMPVSQSGTWTDNINGIVADATAFTRGTTLQLPVGGVVEALQASLTVGQARALSLTQAALLRVDGSNVTQPISAASLPLPTGAALDTSVNGLLVAQGSATSGEKGPLIQGAVTTGAPSYTTAQTSPLSLTLAGALRVDGSAVTQPVSGTVTANAGTGTFNIQANASINLAQAGGTNIATGTGASGAGIPRVTVSNDTELQIWDGTNGPAAVKAASTAAVAADKALVVAVSPNNSVAVTGTITANQGTPAAAANAWPVTLVPQTGNGWSKFSTPKNNSNTPLTTTVVSVKASAAGELGGYIIYNPNSSVAYVQVFDVATSGGVTLGTTRPDVVIPIPATSGANLELANGINFANGIQIAATTTDSGSTAPTTGLTVTMFYK